jgi:hypothetical protein
MEFPTVVFPVLPILYVVYPAKYLEDDVDAGVI